MSASTFADGVEALRTASIVSDVSDRSQLRLRGGDAVVFLHNLCTNDINKLEVGQGCEVFLPTVQGKIVAYLSVFRQDDGLLVDSSVGQVEAIQQHLDRYIIREDVEIQDCSKELGQVVVAGPTAASVVGDALKVDVPGELMQQRQQDWNGRELSIRRTPWLGEPTLQISAPREAVSELLSTLAAGGASLCGADVVATARIQAGSPEYGSDITADNLPQEIDRNDRTISFVKGCYLGQETVARIDALGHVNKKLAKLRFEASPSTVPVELRADDKVVGKLSSFAGAPEGGWIGLGMIRCAHLKAGAQLSADFGNVEVL